jgi:hypothetical protein
MRERKRDERKDFYSRIGISGSVSVISSSAISAFGCKKECASEYLLIYNVAEERC